MLKDNVLCLYLLPPLFLACPAVPEPRVAQVEPKNCVDPMDRYLQYIRCHHVVQSSLLIQHGPVNQCLLPGPWFLSLRVDP